MLCTRALSLELLNLVICANTLKCVHKQSLLLIKLLLLRAKVNLDLPYQSKENSLNPKLILFFFQNLHFHNFFLTFTEKTYFFTYYRACKIFMR